MTGIKDGIRNRLYGSVTWAAVKDLGHGKEQDVSGSMSGVRDERWRKSEIIDRRGYRTSYLWMTRLGHYHVSYDACGFGEDFWI